MYYVQLQPTGTVIQTSDLSLWPEGKRLPAAKGQQILRDEAREHLLSILRPGDTVHTVLRHVSRSGMYRAIDLYSISDEPIYLTGSVARLLGDKQDAKHGDAIGVSGCGMDMGFHLVYNLSHALFPNGFTCAGRHCPSNDHSNGDRNYAPHQHSDGGYALRHRWL